MKKIVWASLLAGFLSLGLSACYDNDGPLEQMGEAADEAVNDTQRAVQDAAD